MNAIKFDETMVKKYIDVYYDSNKKYPYLIMNEKTRDIIPAENPQQYYITGCNISFGNDTTLTPPEENIHSIRINDKEYEEKQKSNPKTSWYKAKILIDNSLEFGEVHIG